ncbi:hypothetical protein GJ744_005541 [Endocarpon pusillum]|uniref:Ubiquitin 3 binding protein But2 C-terminal domain-containing protein n=1 Tax=Endocarpon pusillum TaxID=364733 RepID=A0A8H7ATS5_9EURO|nr:hypothetical protein GJ744_005541 [Endocarpon pusillum]
MHLFTPFLTSLTLGLLTTASALPTADAETNANADASPNPVALAPRACTTIPPSNIDILERGDPTNPHNGLIFNIVRTGTPPRNEYISVVTFSNIPAGATGCMFSLQFPPLAYPNQIATGPAIQADVWSVNPDRQGTSTWNNPPARREFVATTRFPTEASGTGSSTVLASNTCSETMSFLFEHSTWQQGGGSVRFFNSAGGNYRVPPVGFTMVFNC